MIQWLFIFSLIAQSNIMINFFSVILLFAAAE